MKQRIFLNHKGFRIYLGSKESATPEAPVAAYKKAEKPKKSKNAAPETDVE